MGLSLLRFSATGAAVAVCLVITTGAFAAVPPTKTTCPSASLVGSVLGVHLSPLPSTTTAYAKVCSYKTSSVVPMKIQYQTDTPQTFAASENAVPKTVEARLTGLGKAAFGTKAGGFLAVFLGNESVRITAPGASLTQLETLARKLI